MAERITIPIKVDPGSLRHKALIVLAKEIEKLELAHNELDAQLEECKAEWTAGAPEDGSWEYQPWMSRRFRTDENWSSMLDRQRDRAIAAENKLDAVRELVKYHEYDNGVPLYELKRALDG